LLVNNALLLILLILSLLGGNRLVAVASGFLLLLSLLDMREALQFFSDNAIDLGLVLLLVAILAPFALKPPELSELKELFSHRITILALLGGMLATRLQGSGLQLLENQPHVILGLLTGTLLGVLTLGGIPVGPLTGAGLTALLGWIVGKMW